ncbi:MAG TPA: CDP-diacylglycerol--serine O-phosphatidyltransferase [Blastocatellia bacterium]|nr:CDP-diacylglycerol--serine O-phosphatidyltransferase [Blastocatellia bacterium]
MADKTSNALPGDIQDSRLRRRFRKGVFVVPSLLTTANIFCGFYSIMESLAGTRAIEGGNFTAAADHFDRAAINIGFAALFDLLDGRVARMTNATSEFGLELDSIADVVSFGIAPALLAFAWGYGQVPQVRDWGWAASFIFLICGALRLARFNVQARRPSPHLPPKNPKVDKKAFVGMPIPFGAAMIASIAHFAPTPVAYVADVHIGSLVIGPYVFALGLVVLVFLLAFLMVSTLRYSSFKNVGVGNRNPRIIILALALVGLAIWFYSRWTLLIISTVYVAHGIIGKLWSMLKPRRSHVVTSEIELDTKTHT